MEGAEREEQGTPPKKTPEFLFKVDFLVSMELEQGKNVDFWRDMTITMEEEIAKLWKLEAIGKGPGERQEGVNTSVSTDVQSVLKGKTYNQL